MVKKVGGKKEVVGSGDLNSKNPSGSLDSSRFALIIVICKTSYHTEHSDHSDHSDQRRMGSAKRQKTKA